MPLPRLAPSYPVDEGPVTDSFVICLSSHRQTARVEGAVSGVSVQSATKIPRHSI
jgi:hypothetical protein